MQTRTIKVKTAWDREDVSFMFVDATVLACARSAELVQYQQPSRLAIMAYDSTRLVPLVHERHHLPVVLHCQPTEVLDVWPE